ncbi:Gfo/Idh/MocA family oxidoreductase [candidate division WOR-3 bacterium]|nr:Gfo/Idh/MocA family oxidoreductase [candidate division WOR-3 bacterium]
MMKKITVIGAGYWGPNLIRNFYELGCLKTVCDKDEKKLNKIKNKYPNVKFTSNVNEAIRQPTDAVVIATGGDTHYELVKKALLANKDVFVEKPLTLFAEQARELVALSRKKTRILMIGHLLLYHPAVKKLKEYVNDGTLGKIYYVYSQRVNLGKIKKDEDALWSFGPHDISVILYLVDLFPTKVVATGDSYLQTNIPDVVFVTLYFPQKILAHIHLSWLDPHKIRKTTVVGSKKMAVFDDMEATEKIRVYDKGVDYKPSFKPYGEALTLRVGDIVIPKLDSKEPLKSECQHFLKCITERTNPLSDGENGLQVTKILESAQQSLRKGGMPVEI